MANKQLSYTAERVDELLGIVDGLGEATTTEAGLMSAEDKAKLDSVEGGAEENVIEGVQVGGSALTPTNRVVNIPADSAPTSESTNLVRSGGVYTAIQQVANALLNYYTKAQVDALLAGVHQFTYQVVAELPDASADTMYILYFVPSSDPQTQNVKDEYITIRTGSEGAYAYSWERIGSTEIDLSDYPTTEEMNAAIAAAVASKADKDDDAVEGNLAKFDANGNPVDAGIAAEKVAKKGEVQTFAGNLVDTRSAGTRQGPFAFRQSGGDGVNYMRKILGRTEAWNQLFDKSKAYGGTYRDVVITANSDGSYTYNGVSSGVEQFNLSVNHIPLIAGHTYLLTGGKSNDLALRCSDQTSLFDTGNGLVWTAASSGLYALSGRINGGVTYNATIYVKVVDLTLEGLGLTTADQFRALHPLPYYNYNTGVLKNNAATGLETTGFNQWDEEWELGIYNPTSGAKESNPDCIRSKNKIRIFSNTAYYINKAGASGVFGVFYYDENENFISSVTGVGTTVTTPSNATYMTFRCYSSYGTTYNHDICINLSDASRNGIYEPYWKREIVLGLDNLACHDEDNNAVVVNGLDGVGTSYDEAVVENGMVTKIIKRRKRVKMADLGWQYSSSLGFFYVLINDAKVNVLGATANAICARYQTGVTMSDSAVSGAADKILRGYPGAAGFVIRDTAYTDTTNLKAYLGDAYLDYELATPKVLTLDNPIPALIEVDNLGTEKRLPEDTADNPQAPFECDSNYSISVANLVRKLNS